MMVMHWPTRRAEGVAMEEKEAPRNRRVRWVAPAAPVVPRNVRVVLAPADEPVRWWHWLVAVAVVLLCSIDGWN
jgi:hypothetical protein